MMYIANRNPGTSSVINIVGREGICIVRFRVTGDVLKTRISIINSILTLSLLMMVVLLSSCNNIVNASIEQRYYYIILLHYYKFTVYFFNYYYCLLVA